MKDFLALCPSYICYLLFILGLCLVFSKEFKILSRRIKLRHRLEATPKKETGVILYFSELVFAAFGKRLEGSYVLLILMSIFCLMLTLTSRNFSIGAALLASIVMTSLPVLILIVKVESDRSKGSNEGIAFVSELHRQYVINNKNMEEALSAACESGDAYPICKKKIYRLLIRLRGTGSIAERRRAISDFAFSMGTSWGNMLAACIKLSAEKGSDVAGGLEYILSQLKKANQLAEERRRLNSESVRMTIFLVPLLYFGTMLLSVKYFGTTVQELIHNQFFTSEGFMFFMLTVFMFIVNLVLIKLVASAKLDY